MFVAAHSSLTNYQENRLSSQPAAGPRPGKLARVFATLRSWQRHIDDQRQLARLTPRELRDMGASSSDVWNELARPFWRVPPSL